MKNIVLLLVLFTSLNQAVSQKSTSQTAALENILEKVNSSLNKIKGTTYFDGTFDISLKLNNVQTKDDGFNITVLIFSFKRKKTRVIDNSYTVKYKFSTIKANQSKALNDPNKFEIFLNNSLQTYANTEAKQLKRNGFEIVSSFTIDKPGNEASIEIEPVTLGKNFNQKKTVHTLTITFTPNEKSKPSKTEELLEKTNFYSKETMLLLKKYLEESNE